MAGARRRVSAPVERPVPPSLGWRAALATLGRLPQGLLSRLAGGAADLPIPRSLRRAVLGGFARAVGIEVAEAEKPLTEYSSVNAFFVRRLKPGARSFPTDPRVVASPVDGIVGQVGRIEAGQAVQAKGMSYAIADLLRAREGTQRFEGGLFITIYLSPKHYHRIHTPLPGHVRAARHVPGRLFPVNRPAVQWVDELFVVNERLVALVDSDAGPVAVVAVGAFNVGRISAAFDPAWSGDAGTSITNRGSPPPARREYDPPRRIEAGDEMMAFHLGSTVVLLTSPEFELAEGIAPDLEVRAGDPLASA